VSVLLATASTPLTSTQDLLGVMVLILFSKTKKINCESQAGTIPRLPSIDAAKKKKCSERTSKGCFTTNLMNSLKSGLV
jgi:hypothetical protein